MSDYRGVHELSATSNMRSTSGWPWRRLHASAYAVLLLTTVLLLLLNVPGQFEPYVALDGQEQYSIEFPVGERIEHGWPWRYLLRNEFPAEWNWNSAWPQPISVWSLTSEVIEFQWMPLVADAAIAIALLALAGAAFEYWRRQRRRLLQFRLSDLLVGTAMLAIALAYGLHVAREFEGEQDVLVELGLPPLHALHDQSATPADYHGSYDCVRGGPSWLREWMPDLFPLWFDRVTRIDVDRSRKLEMLRQFTQLRSLRISGPDYATSGRDIAMLACLGSP